MLDGAAGGQYRARTSERDLELRQRCSACASLHVGGRAGEIDICSRCCTTIPHPVLVAGSLVLHGKTVRKFLPIVERLTYLSKLPGRLLRPPKPPEPAVKEELVQIRPSGEDL